jgi:hypothetical protein
MRALSLAVATVAALGLAACPGPNNDAIPCADSALCNIEMGGQCIASPLGVDLCAYPTGDCASGLEWGPHSGGLSGECVAADVDASVIDAPIDAGTDAPDNTDAMPDAPPGGPIVVDFQPADLVLGQPTFTTEVENNGAAVGMATASSLDWPNGIASDGSMLLVADAGNARVLSWSPTPATSFAAASLVLGRANFTDASLPVGTTASNLGNSCCRIRVAVAAGRVIVADTVHHRVMVWNPSPTANGEAADFALGQSSLTASTSGTLATKMKEPFGVWTDGTRLVVADTGNHRVLIWNTFPTTNGQAADLVLGQATFTAAAVPQPPTASSMFGPKGVLVDGGRLYVADTSNNRVLIWNTFPTANGQAADLVLGQATFTTAAFGATASAMSLPSAMTTAGGALFVADEANDRVMVFTTIPTASGAAATRVLGQPNLTSSGGDNIAPTQTNLDNPIDLAVADGKLYVTDKEHHRVVRYALNL